MTDIVIHGKATSNLVQDIDQSAILADLCRDATLQCIDLYTNYQTRSYCNEINLLERIFHSSSIRFDRF